MSLKKNFLYNLTLTISQFIFPIVTFPYASRILGVNGVGVTSFVESFSRYFLIFAVMGIPIHGMREISKNKENKIITNKIFVEIFSIQFFITIFCTLIYFCSLFFLKDFDLNWKLYIMGGFLILLNIFSLEWVFQGFEDFKYITIRTVILRFLTIILLFLLVKNEEDYTWYFFLLIFSSSANGIINYYYAKRYLVFGITSSINRLKIHIKPILLTGSYMIAISVYSLLTIIIIGLVSTNDSVGYYTVATKFNRIALGLFSALSAILIPRLTYYVAKGEISDYQKIIERSISFVFAFGFPIGISIYLMAPELIHIFAGAGYDRAIICVQIMSPLILITGLAQVFGPQILIPFSKDKQNLVAVFTGAVASVFLNLLLINFYNEKGASLATIIVETIVAIISFYFAFKVLKINISLTMIIKNIIFIVPYFAFASLSRFYFELDFQVLMAYILFSFTYFFIIQYSFEKKFRLLIASKLSK